jgi:uncharacterized membrane protein
MGWRIYAGNKGKLMRAAVTIARHPIHPMLVPIPIGLWLFSLVCDVVYRLGPGDTVWYTVATYNLIAGIVGALAAAVFGLMDMRVLPAHVKRIAKMHMTINLIVVALYLVNAWLRIRPGEYSDVPLLMSIVAVALLAVSGWLGGHMVYVHGAGVDRDETPAPQATPRQSSSRGGRQARA